MYAVINDNKIVDIRDILEDEMPGVAGRNQHVVEYSSFVRPPYVGWLYENGIAFPDIKSVTPRQIRQAWILSGQSLTVIEIAIDSLVEPHRSLARAEWEYSTIVMRRNPLVAMLANANGYTDEQLDALWIFAGTL
jgi:hypothetical protein